MKGIFETFPKNIIDKIKQTHTRTKWIIVTLFLLFVAVILPSANIEKKGLFSSYIARLSVEGIIDNDQKRLQAIEELKNDSNVQALIVYVNSPGGTIVGGEALYRALDQLNRNHIPVVIVMGELATSAAYMISLAAQRIFAYESTITGSIGVILQTFNITELLNKIGINAETFKSGPLKASPNPFEKIDEKSRIAVEQIIKLSKEFFFSLVQEKRQIDDEIIALMQDGRIILGAQASENGLIDELGGEQEAIKWLIDEYDLDPEISIYEISYNEKDFFGDGLGGGIANLLINNIATHYMPVSAMSSSPFANVSGYGLLSIWSRP